MKLSASIAATSSVALIMKRNAKLVGKTFGKAMLRNTAAAIVQPLKLPAVHLGLSAAGFLAASVEAYSAVLPDAKTTLNTAAICQYPLKILDPKLGLDGQMFRQWAKIDCVSSDLTLYMQNLASEICGSQQQNNKFCISASYL